MESSFFLLLFLYIKLYKSDMEWNHLSRLIMIDDTRITHNHIMYITKSGLLCMVSNVFALYFTVSVLDQPFPTCTRGLNLKIPNQRTFGL